MIGPLKIRKAHKDDLWQYFEWANDPEVRKQSFNSEEIQLEAHSRWFLDAINNERFSLFLFQDHLDNNIGQVRICKEEESEATIGISVGSPFRGMGHSVEMLKIACYNFMQDNPSISINAFVKSENISSKKAFEKAGFTLKGTTFIKGFISYHLIKYANRRI